MPIQFQTQLLFVTGLLFWGLPFLANYWLRRRKKVAGASLFAGRLVIVLWALALVLAVLSIFTGFSKLEGNDAAASQWGTLAMLAAVIIPYAFLLFTLKPGRGSR